MLNKWTDILVGVLFFVAIIGVIANATVNPNENISGGALALYGLILLILIAGFIASLVKTSRGR